MNQLENEPATRCTPSFPPLDNIATLFSKEEHYPSNSANSSASARRNRLKRLMRQSRACGLCQTYLYCGNQDGGLECQLGRSGSPSASPTPWKSPKYALPRLILSAQTPRQRSRQVWLTTSWKRRSDFAKKESSCWSAGSGKQVCMTGSDMHLKDVKDVFARLSKRKYLLESQYSSCNHSTV